MITLKELARMVGVSEAAVSMALNDKAGVSAQKREAIKQLAAEYGYAGNSVAKNLARKRTMTLGLVVPDIENPYYSKLVRCVDEYAHDQGFELLYQISNDSTERERKILQNFVAGKVEGVIVAPVNQKNEDPSYYQLLSRNRIPFVFVCAYYPGVDAPSVMVDLQEGSYRLVRYLLDLGLRQILFMAGRPDIIPTMLRADGYRQAFEERGLHVREQNFVECRRVTFDEAYQTTQKLLKASEPVEAIITSNDIMALGVLKALLERGIKVPEEISVAGYDNVVFSTVSTIPITTVQQDVEKLALNAVGILLDRIHTRREHVIDERFLIDPELIIRQSTGAAAR